MLTKAVLKRWVCLLALALGSAYAHADAVIGDFVIRDGVASASGGTVTFTLNGDGTIAAVVNSLAGNILGFGFDSATPNLPESGFSPLDEPVNPYGWNDMYGDHLSGFLATGLHDTISWTIGTPGSFASVSDALTGTGSAYDFFLLTTSGDQWAANAAAVVPEPGVLILALTALAAGGVSGRRRAAAAATAA